MHALIGGREAVIVEETSDGYVIEYDGRQETVKDVEDVYATKDDLHLAFAALVVEQERLRLAVRAYAQAREAFESTYQLALANGEIEGRNDDTRLGMFRQSHADLVVTYAKTKADVEDCEHAVTLASIKLSMVQSLLVE